MAVETEPAWGPVDAAAAEVLEQQSARDDEQTARQWEVWLDAVADLADPVTGRVDPNQLRERLRGRVDRAGTFTYRAKKARILVWRGEYVISSDSRGKNGGKPCRVYHYTPAVEGAS